MVCLLYSSEASGHTVSLVTWRADDVASEPMTLDNDNEKQVLLANLSCYWLCPRHQNKEVDHKRGASLQGGKEQESQNYGSIN